MTDLAAARNAAMLSIVGGGERRDHAGHNRVFALAALIRQKLLARVFEVLAGENRIGFDLTRPARAVASDARAVVFGFAGGEIGGGIFLGRARRRRRQWP